MDNQLLITWSIMAVVALILDVAAYLFLRADWKKNGTTFVDRFWNQTFDKLGQIAKTWKNRIAIAVVKYHQASLVPESAPTPIPEPEPLPAPAPVEIIPVSVKNIGQQVRRVQFSLDMKLDTQVEVRIGATREAGVTVEKREL